jgi:mannose-6-phosphate isomerase class I
LNARPAPRYDRFPAVASGPRHLLTEGWDAIAARVGQQGARVVLLDAYPGVRTEDLLELVRRLGGTAVDVRAAMKSPAELDALVSPELTDDPVFGRLSALTLDAFFDPARLQALRHQVHTTRGRVVVHGTGAALASDDGLLVHAGLPRWEAQLRQRRAQNPSLGMDNAAERPSLLYKRAYFVDWRVADRHKQQVWSRIAFALDSTDPGAPKLLDARTLSGALAACARRPFRVVPFFDPAPWGGHWMQEVCDVGRDQPNLGWCFDCVPEENSLLLGFGDARFEIPALDLVLREPRALLGEAVHRRFGAEFPIRFDFLDTMGGGNLSLQVHPLAEYIQAHFGLSYTQDESYYLLDAEADASVYLGLREGVVPEQMLQALRAAQAPGGPPFDAEAFVNRFGARKHDHFLIPAGTIHGAGAGSMVLEVSATPYIFTFKLWDWGRLGLDGRSRPIHLEHGARNIQWDRDTAWVQAQLINRVTPLGEGPGWRTERTGLHETEFIDTHRCWFSAPAPQAALDTVQVLNLVQGQDAVVESPDGAFEPFAVSYAETFILPAAAGGYTVKPGPAASARGDACAVLKAFVRP